jgi:hypothetical protein
MARHTSGIRTMRVEFMPGLNLREWGKRCIELMYHYECELIVTVDGVELEILPVDSLVDIVARYHEQKARKSCPKS